MDLLDLGSPVNHATRTGHVENDLDRTLINNLLYVARKRLPGVEKIQTRVTQDSLIALDPDNLVPIILADFALGRGRDNWQFGANDKVTVKLLEDYVLHDIEIMFYRSLLYDEPNIVTYKDFLKRSAPIVVGVRFSPDQIYSLGSLERHISSNKIQFLTGGCVANIKPSRSQGWADVVLNNSTSRESLILHMLSSYSRSDGIRPLSTITQEYRFRMRIDPSRFPTSNEDRSIFGAPFPYGMH